MGLSLVSVHGRAEEHPPSFSGRCHAALMGTIPQTARLLGHQPDPSDPYRQRCIGVDQERGRDGREVHPGLSRSASGTVTVTQPASPDGSGR